MIKCNNADKVSENNCRCMFHDAQTHKPACNRTLIPKSSGRNARLIIQSRLESLLLVGTTISRVGKKGSRNGEGSSTEYWRGNFRMGGGIPYHIRVLSTLLHSPPFLAAFLATLATSNN